MASYENVISELEGIKVSFSQQCESTAQSWNDNQKDKFYGEFVNGYTEKIGQYIGMAKSLGASLENKKKKIEAIANRVK